MQRSLIWILIYVLTSELRTVDTGDLNTLHFLTPEFLEFSFLETQMDYSCTLLVIPHEWLYQAAFSRHTTPKYSFWKIVRKKLGISSGRDFGSEARHAIERARV